MGAIEARGKMTTEAGFGSAGYHSGEAGALTAVSLVMVNSGTVPWFDY